tara:strand:- start:120 stop:851 length:732 start_codon:yes stop_codon:yes gene_type:complete
MAKKKKVEQKHELLYIMSPQCGWCKKADPIVDELKKKYDIRTLDVTNPEESKLAEEFKTKHNAQCGTPLFLDNITGNQVCGFREDVLEDWAKGKEIPKPVQPKGQPPKLPFLGATKKEEKEYKKEYDKWYKDNEKLPGIKTADEMLKLPRVKSDPPRPPIQNPNGLTDEAIESWKKEYEVWLKENNHLPNIQPVDVIVNKLKSMQKSQMEMPTVPNKVSGDIEAKINRIEQKLDKLSKHFGVK